MLTQKTKDIVKATAPVLAEHGYDIIKCFYKRLFEAHPELKNVFNMAHQAIVLISGGVGLTPMVSVLKRAIRDPQRRVVFVHGARNSSVHAMRDRLREAAKTYSNFSVVVFYDAPLPQDVEGTDYDFSGLVDTWAIKDRILLPDADYYIRGPIPFMRMQHDALKDLGIHEARIHYEVFGADLLAE